MGSWNLHCGLNWGAAVYAGSFLSIQVSVEKVPGRYWDALIISKNNVPFCVSLERGHSISSEKCFFFRNMSAM